VLPGPPRLRATRTSGGWLLDGESPWVTGWGMVDTLLAAARDPGDQLVWAVLDARESPGLRVVRQELVAVNASGTVTATFTGHFVPDAHALAGAPAAPDTTALRMNGSLALGVIGRCRSLLGPSPLDAEADACRTALDTALDAALDAADGAAALADARAAASALALRVSAALVARSGSTSVLRTAHPQRLAREAMFLAVFGSRPAIKSALLARLTGG
jgi:hypothetical protein